MDPLTPAQVDLLTRARRGALPSAISRQTSDYLIALKLMERG
jgi:hypothetical protein